MEKKTRVKSEKKSVDKWEEEALRLHQELENMGLTPITIGRAGKSKMFIGGESYDVGSNSYEERVKVMKKYLKNPKNKNFGKKQIKSNMTSTNGKNYFIHDNGGRPFMVNVDGRKVKVYKFTSKDIEVDDPEQYQKLIKEFDVEQYFIGKDDSVNTKFGEGNSILLELDDGVYVYIGSEIYQFEPDDQILEYHSTIGNSDVPYPITLGEENAYFMLDGKYIPLKKLEGIDVSEMYGEFYQNKSLKSFKMKGKKMIQKP